MLIKSHLMYLTLYVRDLDVSRRFYEGVLAYRPLLADGAAATYQAGHTLLTLRSAAADGVALAEGKDRSLTLTFLVDGVEAMRAAIAGRGGRPSPTYVSPAGTMMDFYDPDGHWFSLYEPSDMALGWDSGRKIKALRQAGAAYRAALDAPPGMAGQELLYLFLFVQDLHEAVAFYHDALGLEPIEVTHCHRDMTGSPEGVVKYDVGGTMLTTHHVGDGDHAKLHKVTTDGSAGIALGFHATDLEAAVEELTLRGVRFTGAPVGSPLGRTAAFQDQGGHRYYLCEPAPETIFGPAGEAIERIRAAAV